jgi:glycerate kinase
MMRIVIAPDKFKGSVTATPVADGGDGTVDAGRLAVRTES